MSEQKTSEQVLEIMVPNYSVLYLGLQFLSILTFKLMGHSPLLIIYVVALMTLRYTLNTLSVKYQQPISIIYARKMVATILVCNMIVTVMCYITMDMRSTLSEMIEVFVYLNIFSYTAVLLQKWYSLIRCKFNKK